MQCSIFAQHEINLAAERRRPVQTGQLVFDHRFLLIVLPVQDLKDTWGGHCRPTDQADRTPH